MNITISNREWATDGHGNLFVRLGSESKVLVHRTGNIKKLIDFLIDATGYCFAEEEKDCDCYMKERQ